MRSINAHDSESTEAVDDSSSLSATDVDVHAGKIGHSAPAPAAQKAKTKITIILIVAIVSATAGIVAYFMNSTNVAGGASHATAAPPAVTVSTTKVKTQTVDDTVSVTGSVSAWDPLSIGAEAGGMRITDVSVEEGDLVRKGQILATLNSSVLKAQLLQARAKLASAQASVKKSIQPNRPEEINALRQLLAQNDAEIKQEEALKKEARITLDDASLNASRWTKLAAAGGVSKVDAEAKQVAEATAREELSSADAKLAALRSVSAQAREKLKLATSGGRVEDVDISKAVVAETQGHIQELEHQIEQTFIKAPDDGLVVKRDAHIGSITSVGTPLFSIIRGNRLELRAQVADIDLSKFKVGQTVKIAINEDDDGKILGRVSLVSPQVDQASRLGTVRVTLPANAGLKDGMFVRGQVDLGHRKALTVPSTAVITRNGESFVFTLAGNRVQSIPVTIGVRTDKFAEIRTGLKSDETIVDAGARFLSDRDVVRVEK